VDQQLSNVLPLGAYRDRIGAQLDTIRAHLDTVLAETIRLRAASSIDITPSTNNVAQQLR
jgi:hypothetical protein